MDLRGTYIGEVVDNNDPLKEFRCKIRVYGLMDKLKDDELIWFYPDNNAFFSGGNSKGFGSGSVPKVGSKVKVKFLNNDIYSGVYYSIENINESLRNEIADDYLNTHVLLYDEEQQLKVIYQPNRGFEIYLKESHILINPDSSITIEHKGTSSIIELLDNNIKIIANSTVEITAQDKVEITAKESILNGTQVTKLGPTPSYSGVLAEPLFAALKQLANMIDSKYPTSAGVASSLIQQAEQLATSKNVKLTK
jgi:hypothetical protein